ncbi:Multidomain signal transduction protein including CheB-like methylesterase, CheR-like methyltransferase and BaeS-like histidine kinase [uncultured Leptolyngbya sp.]|uniref:protein-glutamate O-methyltransferase n=1 Tax=uncultured Leptolyngbya sp. TaxID=332963 RepID=A0A6J4K4S8_9CYAN|nr:Multidomain signal transduction protein including CheB-like methylesterase, CheR-like methyltransferase and BaeS-like histidine kinase [uncultured Leptolyngbya sp.]
MPLGNALLELTASSEQILFEEAQEFEAFLNYLWESYSFDFTGYKRPSLMRRVQQRMEVIAIASYSDYINYLKKSPEEATLLFESLPVNCTAFFRDQQVWDEIATEIIPQIIANKSSDELIKVWSAGCATGEEAYTLAILLIEALGIEQFKQRVKIYATDASQEAIYQARQGSYSRNQVVGIPPGLLAKYFEQIDQRYSFRQDLRRRIIFAQSNLLQDAPISKVDLLVCRNTLIYFNLEGQLRALVRLHFGLRDSGFLVLGRSESPTATTGSALFSPVNQQQRIFTRVPKACTPKLFLKAFHQQKYKLPTQGIYSVAS